MEINEGINKYKLFIATPMYGGECKANYAISLVNLSVFLTKAEIEFRYEILWNDALITRARNDLVRKFIQSDYDVMLFIDSDIGFNWENVATMLDMMITSEDKKIICGAYPRKEINWKNIDKAYKKDFIQNSENVLDYASTFVLNFKDSDNTSTFFDVTKPVKVLESGTGFMMIHKEVFDKFKEAYPEQMSIDPDTKTELFYYFDCKIEEKTKYYLSEDYMFCQYASKIGYDTWVIPWADLTHSGIHIYSGSFDKYSKMYYQLNKDNKEIRWTDGALG